MLSTVVADTLLTTAHTVGLRWELASALVAAIILADAAVTSVSEMTKNVSSGTLNLAQPAVNCSCLSQRYKWQTKSAKVHLQTWEPFLALVAACNKTPAFPA